MIINSIYFTATLHIDMLFIITKASFARSAQNEACLVETVANQGVSENINYGYFVFSGIFKVFFRQII